MLLEANKINQAFLSDANIKSINSSLSYVCACRVNICARHVIIMADAPGFEVIYYETR